MVNNVHIQDPLLLRIHCHFALVAECLQVELARIGYVTRYDSVGPEWHEQHAMSNLLPLKNRSHTIYGRATSCTLR